MSDIQHARAVRQRRGRILRRLATGERSLRKTLQRPPKAISGMTVYDLLVASYNMGPTGSSNTLYGAGVVPIIAVGKLTSLERREIIKHLPKRAT